MLSLLFICSYQIAKSEISNEEIKIAKDVFKRNLNSQRNLIISMRWNSFQEQLRHFIFGTALAYALNVSVTTEILRFPISDPQPKNLLGLKMNRFVSASMDSFRRVRVNREITCKSIQNITGYDENETLLLRNFDEITLLYANKQISQRLHEMFGIHAGYHIIHHFLKKSTTLNKNYIGVECVTMPARRMKNITNPDLISQYFIKSLTDRYPATSHFKIVANDPKIKKKLKRVFKNVEFYEPDIEGFWAMVDAKEFTGTYRSRFGTLVGMARGTTGLLIDTESGIPIEQSRSQSGILSPFLQDVEDCEYTVNEKLRRCKDNGDEVYQVLQEFVI